MNELLQRVRPASGRGWAASMFALGGALFLVAAFINLQSVARTESAATSFVGAQRAVEANLPLYSAAPDQQGPLALLGYVVSYTLGGERDAWWFIAALIVLVAAVTAAATWVIAMRAGDGSSDATIAGAAATGLFVYLMFGEADFQHSLAARNIAWMLLAVALAAITLAFRRGARREFGVVVAGAAVGLAVQTNLTSAPAALVFLAYVIWLTRRDCPTAGAAARTVALFAGAAVIALASAAGWYAVRGGLGDFWTNWWSFQGVYFQGDGESFLSSVAHGAMNFGRYLRNHPLQPLILTLFAFDLADRRRSGADISLSVMVFSWWLAECLTTVVGQRFLGAGMVPPAVPAGLMTVLMAARHGESVPAAHRPLAIGVIVLATVYIAGATRVPDSLRALRDFRSPATSAEQRLRGLYPPDLKLRQAVAANSGPRDYVYAWTEHASTYTLVGRSAATRYAEQQPLRGTIPSGATGPRFAAAGAWSRWAADLRRTEPLLWIQNTEYPVPSDLPLKRVRDCAFEVIYRGGGRTLYKRARPLGPCLDRARPGRFDAANERARQG